MKNVLVVDDEETLVMIMVGRFEDYRDRFNVFTANNGKEAVKILESETIDLVVTDLKMPEIGGIELLEEIRGQGDETPVILITAYGTIDTAVSAMKGGASDYIVKPFQRDTLLVSVEKALATEKLRRENEKYADAMEPIKALDRKASSTEMGSAGSDEDEDDDERAA